MGNHVRKSEFPEVENTKVSETVFDRIRGYVSKRLKRKQAPKQRRHKTSLERLEDEAQNSIAADKFDDGPSNVDRI